MGDNKKMRSRQLRRMCGGHLPTTTAWIYYAAVSRQTRSLRQRRLVCEEQDADYSTPNLNGEKEWVEDDLSEVQALLGTPRRLLIACGDCEGKGFLSGGHSRRSARAKRKKRETGSYPRNDPKKCLRCEGSGLVTGEPMKNHAQKPVGIIGGGIGGLALALGLTHRGVDCRVYERDASFFTRRPGYGLTLQQGGRALRALGVLDLVRDAGIWTPAHGAYDGVTGEALGEHGAKHRKKDETKVDFAVHVPRQSLRAILLSQLPENVVRWNAPVNNFSEENNDLFFESHSLMVGADGLRSQTRRRLFPETDDGLEKVSDLVVLFGRADYDSSSSDDEPPSVFQVVDGAARLYAMPYNKRQIMWQLSWRRTEALPKGQEALHAVAKDVVSHWSRSLPPSVRDLVDRTDSKTVQGYPILDRQTVFPSDSIQQRTLLVGDAAHPMAPFKAQGANQALLDAISLARKLADAFLKNIDIDDAITDYHEEMEPRALAKMRASRSAALLLHSPAARTPSSGRLTRSAAALQEQQQTTTPAKQGPDLLSSP